MTRRITYRVSASRKQTSSGKVRLVFGVLSGTYEDGSAVPADKLRVFLFHKPEDVTGELSVSEAGYLGTVPVHAFNLVDRPVFGTSNPAEWSGLPATTIVLDPEARIDDAVIPTDEELGYFAVDRIITSGAYVFEGDAAGAAAALETVRTQLTALCTNYSTYADASTMMDVVLYPEGWDEENI